MITRKEVGQYLAVRATSNLAQIGLAAETQAPVEKQTNLVQSEAIEFISIVIDKIGLTNLTELG